ncbi:MAG: hypothetical protein ACRESS_09690 [Stenotrophobium sp.]
MRKESPVAWIKKIMVASVLALSGCAQMPAFTMFFPGTEAVDVVPAGYSLDCGTQRPETTVRTLANADELQQWQVSRGLKLLRDDAPRQGPYALIELGARASGGYGLVVSRDAELRKNVLILHATLFAPDSDHPGASQPSSPCALISMPPGLYRGVSVVDQSGRVLANSLPGD